MSNVNQVFSIGGVSVTELKNKYQTPLYVMDEQAIRTQCQKFMTSFKDDTLATEVIYASKAFLTLQMCQLIQQEGLSLDVVSGGELYTAVKAKFPMEKVFFHGNNKSTEELQMALHYNIGHIVIDHQDEFKELCKLLKPHDRLQVLLRINPGIEAHTHEYIKTTKNDSKFGLSIFSEDTLSLIQEINQHPQMTFKGFHSHIGSQIFEEKPFLEHATAVLNYIKHVYDKTHIQTAMMNLGGGFGVTYTSEDQPIDIKVFLPRLNQHIKEVSNHLEISTPKVLIEPGRAIVAEAGYTLYTINSTKQTFGGKDYVFVDGSMADHMRTALYQAKYHAFLGNRMQEMPVKTYTVAGKACESGDVIIKDLQLPIPNHQDILVVKTTGAYHYSMSSNYNRLLKPAVVFVKDGQARLVVKRETYQDLIRNDIE